MRAPQKIRLLGDHALEREHRFLRMTGIERYDAEQVIEVRGAGELGFMAGQECVGLARLAGFMQPFRFDSKRSDGSAGGTRLERLAIESVAVGSAILGGAG